MAEGTERGTYPPQTILVNAGTSRSRMPFLVFKRSCGDGSLPKASGLF